MPNPQFQSYVSSLPIFKNGKAGKEKIFSIFFQLIDILRPSVFCDIGANDGNVCKRVKEYHPDCEVHGFEANPALFERYKFDHYTAGIHWHNVAITSASGKRALHTPRKLSRTYPTDASTDMDSSARTVRGHTSLFNRAENTSDEHNDVCSKSLDDFFSVHRRPSDRSFFLCIDAEGATGDILAGASGILKYSKAVLAKVERDQFRAGQTGAVSVFETLYRHGFEPFVRDREDGDRQFNTLFLRKTAIRKLDQGFLPRILKSHFQNNKISTTQDIEQNTKFLRTPPQIKKESIKTQKIKVPAFVPCHDNPSYCQIMLEQLINIGFNDIFFLDNKSTTSDMQSWLEKAEKYSTVIRLGENLGPRDSITSRRIFPQLPKYFCLTDPDVEFNPHLPENFIEYLIRLTEFYNVGKAGFALNIAERSQMKDDAFKVDDNRFCIWEWEEKFWRHPLAETADGDRVYRANIDTTFALYNKKYFNPQRFLKAVRIAGRFTARHMPWYKESRIPKQEELNYAKNSNFSFYLKKEI